MASEPGRGKVFPAGADSLRGGVLSSSTGEPDWGGAAVAKGAAQAGRVSACVPGREYRAALSRRANGAGDD